MPATSSPAVRTCGLILLSIAILAGAASAELVLVSGQAGSASAAAAWNSEGNTYASQYRWDAAIDAYTRAIAIDPGLARAYFGRGVAYAALKHYDGAIADYEAAIAADPSQRPVVEPYLESAVSVRYPTIPSGSLVKGSWQPGNHYLAIDNSKGTSDILVALAPRGSKGAILAVYVAKGFIHTFEQAVPAGNYDVYITFGERWDTKTRSFAREGGYLRWELPQYFTGSPRQGYTMTFVDYRTVPGGWSYTLSPIAKDQFPAL